MNIQVLTPVALVEYDAHPNHFALPDAFQDLKPGELVWFKNALGLWIAFKYEPPFPLPQGIVAFDATMSSPVKVLANNIPVEQIWAIVLQPATLGDNMTLDEGFRLG